METFERNWLVKNFMPSLFTAAELDGIAEEEVSDEDRESRLRAAYRITLFRSAEMTGQ